MNEQNHAILIADREDAEVVHQLRTHRIPGYEVDVITDPTSILGAEAIGHYDLVHVATPRSMPVTRFHSTPVMLTHDGELQHGPLPAELSASYRAAAAVLSPCPAADDELAACGVLPGGIVRWSSGVDHGRFNPARYSATALPSTHERFHILYAGPLEEQHGVSLLSGGFVLAQRRDPRLTLVCTGTGSAEPRLRAELGSAALFLHSLSEDQLGEVYASSDLLVAPSARDASCDPISRAQASGLPVLAVECGGAPALIESARSGCLIAPEPEVLGAAIFGLARRAALRDRLVTGGLLAARTRTWEQALSGLGAIWDAAVAAGASAEVVRAA